MVVSSLKKRFADGKSDKPNNFAPSLMSTVRPERYTGPVTYAKGCKITILKPGRRKPSSRSWTLKGGFITVSGGNVLQDRT